MALAPEEMMLARKAMALAPEEMMLALTAMAQAPEAMVLALKARREGPRGDCAAPEAIVLAPEGDGAGPRGDSAGFSIPFFFNPEANRKQRPTRKLKDLKQQPPQNQKTWTHHPKATAAP